MVANNGSVSSRRSLLYCCTVRVVSHDLEVVIAQEQVMQGCMEGPNENICTVQHCAAARFDGYRMYLRISELTACIG